MIQVLYDEDPDVLMDLGLPLGGVWLGTEMTMEERREQSRYEPDYQRTVYWHRDDEIDAYIEETENIHG